MPIQYVSAQQTNNLFLGCLPHFFPEIYLVYPSVWNRIFLPSCLAGKVLVFPYQYLASASLVSPFNTTCTMSSGIRLLHLQAEWNHWVRNFVNVTITKLIHCLKTVPAITDLHFPVLRNTSYCMFSHTFQLQLVYEVFTFVSNLQSFSSSHFHHIKFPMCILILFQPSNKPWQSGTLGFWCLPGGVRRCAAKVILSLIHFWKSI